MGVNLLTTIFSSDNHRFGLEVIFPIDQDAKNLQMKTDYKVIFGYRKAYKYIECLSQSDYLIIAVEDLDEAYKKI